VSLHPGDHPPPGTAPRVVPFGDSAFLVQLGDGVDEALSAAVHACGARIARERPGSTPVPGYASLLVTFDPRREDPGRVERILLEAARASLAEMDALVPVATGRLVELAVRYGGDDGPDLEEVAERTGLVPAEVVALHAGVEYRVFFLGFVPGFAYLGTLPDRLELPRRPEPRVRVPRGSVAIAGRQTAVYPVASPGGWHLIGRTERVLWDPHADPRAILRPGDRVRFVPA
jgi:inhibitor of KinA